MQTHCLKSFGTARYRPGALGLSLGTLLTTALLAAGCSKCAGEKPITAPAEEITRYLPKDADLALVVPDIGILGDRIAQLQGLKLVSFLAQPQGFADANELATALMRQVGVDLRSREELKKFGIAPERGLAVALLPQDVVYAVIGVADPKVFEASVQKLAASRLGAGTLQRRAVQSGEIVTFSRGEGDRARLGFVWVGAYAVLSAGAMVEDLPKFAALSKSLSLAEDSQLRASLSRLPKERDLYIHAPASLTAKRRPGLVSFTATARLVPDALRVHVDAPWPQSQQTLAALDLKEGGDLTSQLPQDAFLVARFGGDPVALGPIWPLLVGPHLDGAFKDAKVNVQQDILGNVQPGMVLSLSVSPTIPLGTGMPDVDVRHTNPFRYAHLVAYAQPKDGTKVVPLMEQMPQIAPRFGARIEPVEKEGQKYFVTRYSQGEGVHFAQKNGRLVLASPLARLEQTVSAMGEDKANSPPPLLKDAQLKDVLTTHAVGVVMDLDQLRESVKALPSEAWGVGGFAIRASAVRWLDATDDLKSVTLGVSRKETSVQAEFALRFAQK